MKSTIICSLILFFTQVAFAANSGTYTVPLDSDFATNDVGSVMIVEDSKGTTFLSYSLPEDLVGANAGAVDMTLQHMTVNGDSVVAKFKDMESGSWALCQGSESSLSCTTEYEGNFYDQSRRDAFLKDKFKADPDVLREKLRVAHNFSGDPIGILSIQCEVTFCGLQ